MSIMSFGFISGISFESLCYDSGCQLSAIASKVGDGVVLWSSLKEMLIYPLQSGGDVLYC